MFSSSSDNSLMYLSTVHAVCVHVCVCVRLDVDIQVAEIRLNRWSTRKIDLTTVTLLQYNVVSRWYGCCACEAVCQFSCWSVVSRLRLLSLTWLDV